MHSEGYSSWVGLCVCCGRFTRILLTNTPTIFLFIYIFIYFGRWTPPSRNVFFVCRRANYNCDCTFNLYSVVDKANREETNNGGDDSSHLEIILPVVFGLLLLIITVVVITVIVVYVLHRWKN